MHLQYALDFLARTHIRTGDLATAARLVEEDRLIAEVTGNPPVAYAEMMLAAWRGQEARAAELIEATKREGTAHGQGRLVDFAAYSGAVLYNGLGRHDVARDAARRAFERDQLGYGAFVVPELAEAASRTGDLALVRAALEWLSEHTRIRPTEWALGMEALVRALLSEDAAADSLYRESIAHLGRTRVRAELARARLLYGEWLRRQRRRVDAREQLSTAHDMLAAMGIQAFADRARRELAATGETARKRAIETSSELTAQETQVARLARDGLSNPEIGARLFISARTVQYHLGKVFTKLTISSRSQLGHVLPPDPDTRPAPLAPPDSPPAAPADDHGPLNDLSSGSDATCSAGPEGAFPSPARPHRRPRRAGARAVAGASWRSCHRLLVPPRSSGHASTPCRH
jgi:ATP/maltotriose-dependent transcriptional regulator MalT